MTLANPKPLGWGYGEILTSAQANSFGTQMPYALDGNGGGSYSPSAPIIVGGSGLQIAKLRWPAVALPAFDNAGAGVWDLDFMGAWRYSTATASTSDTLSLPLPAVWIAGTLSAVRIWVCASHGSTNSPEALPTTKPKLGVYKHTLPTSGPTPVLTQLGSTATDSSATITDYKTPHYIEVSGLSESIGLTEAYSIRITPSSGDTGGGEDDIMVLSVEAELSV